tara:strand:+ start:1069 stop:1902 length:834 start_codon:yes stop_codon:yes gene_type:complete
MFLNILPRKISLFFGRLIGITIYHILPIRKKIALENIKDNFPNLSTEKQLKILKNTYIHFGMVLTDFLRTKRLNKNNINQIVKIDTDTWKLLKDNNGAIIMTGHLGNWEYFLPTFGLNGLKFSIVAQKIKNSYLNTFFTKIRQVDNVEVIFKDAGSRKMMKILKEKKYLGLASDQNAGKKGEKVKLLNIEASIPKGAAIFHLKTKTPIIVGYCIMNQKYNYNFNAEMIDCSKINREKDDAIYTINRNFTKNLERMIKKYPEQYFWFHRMKDKKKYQK